MRSTGSSVGAQPTEQVAALLKLTGDWGKFKGDKDAVSTVKVKEPKAPFEIDATKKSVDQAQGREEGRRACSRGPPADG